MIYFVWISLSVAVIAFLSAAYAHEKAEAAYALAAEALDALQSFTDDPCDVSFEEFNHE